jgi:hypothetical protein
MIDSRFLVVGNGHLAHRTMLLLEKQNIKTSFNPYLFLDILSNKSSKIEDFSEILESIEIESFDIVYILFEEDNQNLETVIALNTLYPIPLSGSNVKLGPFNGVQTLVIVSFRVTVSTIGFD